jgi:zinc transport system substrate-binding protein
MNTILRCAGARRRWLRFGVAVVLAGATLPAMADAEAPPVFVTIKPIHSLVASVMRGVGTPYLLLKGGASPHAYALRPSEARHLARARLVFWVGEELEAFLEKPLGALGRRATVVALHGVPGVRLLRTRAGGVWETARDGDETHARGRPDGHGEYDMHVWLDPRNARAMVGAIAKALVKADPGHATAYRANAAATAARLGRLDAELDRTLAPVRARRFIVFHDAYQYFETRYRLAAAGALTVNPQRTPGAQRLSAIRKRIVEAKVRCVFVEPQFAPRLVDTIVSGTPAKKAVLDPLGAAIPAGPDAYFILMRNLATALRNCLST